MHKQAEMEIKSSQFSLMIMQHKERSTPPLSLCSLVQALLLVSVAQQDFIFIFTGFGNSFFMLFSHFYCPF